jgi:hypothetical protein
MTALRARRRGGSLLFTIALVLPLSAVAFAQPAQGPGGRGPGSERVPPPFVLMGGEGAFERETVRGAPYSAKTETELVQSLADGNRISGNWTGFVARDSEGRVRREQPLAAIGPLLAQHDSPRLTVIHDPVERLTLFLDPETKTARRMPWPEEGGAGKGEGRAAEAERQGSREGGGLRPPMFERRGPLALPYGTAVAPSTEPLGSREIAGVAAQGTRSTYVIPAGQIGNERPLSIISERWTSAELNAVLETRYSDPRTGQTRFRLTQIDRREPARALFEVPAGYTVEDGPPRMGPRVAEPHP